jgi:Na+/H+ antiporter NhaA
MIAQIALTPFLGKPLIMYGGLMTLLLVLGAGILGMLILKGKRIPLSFHIWLARLAILAALLHGILGLSLFYHF